MKAALTLLLAVFLVGQNGCGLAGGQPAAQNGITGKWRSTDGSYNVEFLSNGNCSARMRLQGRDVGGPCTYTADQSAITIHYEGMTPSPSGQANSTVIWHYTLAGDVLTVSVFATSLVLKRVH